MEFHRWKEEDLDQGPRSKVTCEGQGSSGAPIAYYMNWLRPLRTGHELVLSNFVRLIFKIVSNWVSACWWLGDELQIMSTNK